MSPAGRERRAEAPEDGSGRGATLVNDDLEVGYDERFERRWIGVQYAGLLLMVLFASCCAAGLLGRGPFSHAEATSGDGTLGVQYERVVREETGTVITLRLRNAGIAARAVSVVLSGASVAPMGLERFEPRPDSAMATDGGIALRFTVAPRQAGAEVRITAMPGRPGLMRLRAWTGGGPDDAILPDVPGAGHAVAWTQLVLP